MEVSRRCGLEVSHRSRSMTTWTPRPNFVECWCNLQPTRNRKNVEAPSQPVPLADSTKKIELERLRAFYRFCKDRGWMKNEFAKKITHKAKTEKKFGLLPDEEARLFDAIINPELRAFCLVLRHSGARMCDATVLDESQLVVRASGKGWALKFYQKKAQEWVYIPIPDFVADALRNLEIKGEANGKRYWFWTGNGDPTTARKTMLRLSHRPQSEQANVSRHHGGTPDLVMGILR